MSKPATTTQELAEALNSDALPFVYASSIATWRRDGPILFLSFVEHRPLSETLELSRSVPIARIMIPIAGLGLMIATLQDAFNKTQLADAASAAVATERPN